MDAGGLNGAGTELVENLDVLRRRLARGQHPDHGRALARRLAVLLGVRRRPHLRGRFARPRPALRAGQCLGRHHASQTDRLGRDLARPHAGRHQALRQGHRALHPPMYWAERSGALLVAPDPESTRWCLTLYEAPMRAAEGFSITLSPYRKPSMECMPVDAKAGCLYPNNARALIEANARGFGNCAVRDLVGNVAELATANLFIGKGGVVFTPAPNGTFLNGITRQRVIKLLRAAGVSVVETTLQYSDLQNADEIFSSGNYSKVMPFNRIDERSLQPGPLYRKARELYGDFAHSAAG